MASRRRAVTARLPRARGYMLAVVVAMAVAVGGCGPPIWCNKTVLEAQPAVVEHDGDQQVVRFSARLTDRSGRPIEGAQISLGPRFKRPDSEHPVRPALLAPLTDAEGWAHTHLTIERLTREARITGAVQDTWYGVYRRPHETRGFIDCAASDEAPMPAELVGIDGR